jgi:hypothetical protein
MQPQERLAALVEERKKLIDGGGELGGGAPGATGGHPGGGSGGGAAPNSAATSAMIEKEKHKLEVLKRRQERDIQQVGRPQHPLWLLLRRGRLRPSDPRPTNPEPDPRRCCSTK